MKTHTDNKAIWNGKAAVTNLTPTAAGSIFLDFSAPEIAGKVAPGQFVYIKSSYSSEPLLRRAFSVMDTDPENGIIKLYIDVKGAGTINLARLKVGEQIDVLGPLGHGFTNDMFGSDNVLIGGGCGMAPLIMLAKKIRNQGGKVRFYYGGRNSSQLALLDIVSQIADTVMVTTDDGSYGEKGVITNFLSINSETRIFSCGPKPMLRAVAAIAPDAFVALETEMACGMGVCMGCIVAMKNGSVTRCCTEGPVYKASEVEWS